MRHRQHDNIHGNASGIGAQTPDTRIMTKPLQLLFLQIRFLEAIKLGMLKSVQSIMIAGARNRRYLHLDYLTFETPPLNSNS